MNHREFVVRAKPQRTGPTDVLAVFFSCFSASENRALAARNTGRFPCIDAAYQLRSVALCHRLSAAFEHSSCAVASRTLPQLNSTTVFRARACIVDLAGSFRAGRGVWWQMRSVRDRAVPTTVICASLHLSNDRWPVVGRRLSPARLVVLHGATQPSAVWIREKTATVWKLRHAAPTSLPPPLNVVLMLWRNTDSLDPLTYRLPTDLPCWGKRETLFLRQIIRPQTSRRSTRLCSSYDVNVVTAASAKWILDYRLKWCLVNYMLRLEATVNGSESFRSESSFAFPSLGNGDETRRNRRLR